jgi:hypothetical protein
MAVETSTFTLANATTLNQAVGLANGVTLKGVTAFSQGLSTGPFAVALNLFIGRDAIYLASGWTRQDANGFVDPVSWFGALTTMPGPAENQLKVQARNDTGSTVTIRVSWDVGP